MGNPLLTSGEASSGPGLGREHTGPKAALSPQPWGKKLPEVRYPRHTPDGQPTRGQAA